MSIQSTRLTSIFLLFSTYHIWTGEYTVDSTLNLCEDMLQAIAKAERLSVGNKNNNIISTLLTTNQSIEFLLKLTPLKPEAYLMSFFHVCQLGTREMVQSFIDAKFDCNVQNMAGQTPLMIACSAGNVDVVQKLIECGSNVHAKDSRGWSAIDFTHHGEASWQYTSNKKSTTLNSVFGLISSFRYSNINPFAQCLHLLREAAQKKIAESNTNSALSSAATTVAASSNVSSTTPTKNQ